MGGRKSSILTELENTFVPLLAVTKLSGDKAALRIESGVIHLPISALVFSFVTAQKNAERDEKHQHAASRETRFFKDPVH